MFRKDLCLGLGLAGIHIVCRNILSAGVHLIGGLGLSAGQLAVFCAEGVVIHQNGVDVVVVLGAVVVDAMVISAPASSVQMALSCSSSFSSVMEPSRRPSMYLVPASTSSMFTGTAR